jgi:hypothetical protein
MSAATGRLGGAADDGGRSHFTRTRARQARRARPGFRCASTSWRASAGAAGCWVQGAPSQSSGPPGPVLVYDVFWLLSFGLYVPVPARLAPVVPPGACAPEKSSPALLRRLFPPKIFRVLPSRVDGTPRAQLRKLRQQPKNNGGRGELAGHLDRPDTPTSLQGQKP